MSKYFIFAEYKVELVFWVYMVHTGTLEKKIKIVAAYNFFFY